MKTFEECAAEAAALVTKKNAAYGNSFDLTGSILRMMAPNGLTPEGYGSLLTVARVIDKLFRIMNDPTAFGEDPWKDIMGYALLEVRKASREIHVAPVLRIEEHRAEVKDAAVEALRLIEAVWREEVPKFADLTAAIKRLNDAGVFVGVPLGAEEEEPTPVPTAPAPVWHGVK